MLRTPLFHFLTLGALLAAAVWVTRGPPVPVSDPKEIVVSEANIAHLKAKWTRTWNRPPTSEELRGAVDKFVRNEIFYQQALARGLERNDPSVRLVLVRTMEMLARTRTGAPSLTDSDVEAFFNLRQERYRLPATLSIAQVYAGDGPDAEQTAGELLEQLRREDPATDRLSSLGDPIMLESVYANRSAPDLERTFGADFVAGLLPLPIGTWEGPIRSGYGLHLVKVLALTPSRLPVLDDVRTRVQNDLFYEAGKTAEDAAYQEAAAGYRVVFTPDARRILEGNSP